MLISHTFLNGASYFVSIVAILNFFIALTIIFLERKNSSATLAWLLVLFLLPLVGIVLYFLFSQNIARQKIYKLTQKEVSEISGSLAEQAKEMNEGKYEFSTKAAKKWKDMIKLHQTYGNSYYTQDNRIFILTDGRHMFDSLISDIKNAKYSINIMYYIIKNDAVGRTLIDTLTQKAAEGVEVRLLVDAMGGRQLSDRTFKEFAAAGGKYAFFFPPKFKFLNMKLNYRNHRKLVAIDGSIGYIGGFNIAREYLGMKKKFGYWRDTHLRVFGSAVQDINAHFMMDWRVAAKEELGLADAYYSDVISVGHSGMQIVSCGPNSEKEEIKRGYMRMITSARKNVYIQTPYFVPDASILESLKMAAQSGVDVRIMIPCKPDHMFVYWATYSFVGELVNSGARVFIYDKGFLHAKTIVVDGEVASVGSANFDRRSFKLNFETNAFVYDEEEAYKMEAIFENDMADCHELTKALYRKRSMIIKFKESISRLVSDLL